MALFFRSRRVRAMPQGGGGRVGEGPKVDLRTEFTNMKEFKKINKNQSHIPGIQYTVLH